MRGEPTCCFTSIRKPVYIIFMAVTGRNQKSIFDHFFDVHTCMFVTIIEWNAQTWLIVTPICVLQIHQLVGCMFKHIALGELIELS